MSRRPSGVAVQCLLRSEQEESRGRGREDKEEFGGEEREILSCAASSRGNQISSVRVLMAWGPVDKDLYTLSSENFILQQKRVYYCVGGKRLSEFLYSLKRIREDTYVYLGAWVPRS